MSTISQRSKSQRAEKLAAALLRDRERPVPPTNNPILECFLCGRAYTRRPVSGDDGNSRFCNRRCEDAFDAGFPPFDPNRDRALTNLPLSTWVVGTARYYEPVLRRSRAWRKLGKSEEWTPVHKLKICPKKPNKIKNLQGDFSGPTDPPIRSDWTPSDNIDPNHPDLAIPDFLDRCSEAVTDLADVLDESVEQSRRAA
jgi:hypothetical protein